VNATILSYLLRSLLALFLTAVSLDAQTLLNVDFGVGTQSKKIGQAATGQSTNDFWNLYRHYDPKFIPGAPLIANGALQHLKLADGTETKIALAVTNAPGVWGNASGDAMYDTYIFANNGSNISVVIHGLEAGRYHFYLYGHADPRRHRRAKLRLHRPLRHQPTRAAYHRRFERLESHCALAGALSIRGLP